MSRRDAKPVSGRRTFFAGWRTSRAGAANRSAVIGRRDDQSHWREDLPAQRGAAGQSIGRKARSCATFVLGRPCQELVAQLVEQRTFNAWVLGSIPSELTTPQAANLSEITPNSALNKSYSFGPEPLTPLAGQAAASWRGTVRRRPHCILQATSQPAPAPLNARSGQRGDLS